MNEVDAKSMPVMGGFHGLLRKVHRAAYETVNENGTPILFPSALAAENAAWRALRAHLCGDIVGDGPKASIARAEGDFARIFPGKGRKPIVVERR